MKAALQCDEDSVDLGTAKKCVCSANFRARFPNLLRNRRIENILNQYLNSPQWDKGADHQRSHSASEPSDSIAARTARILPPDFKRPRRNQLEE
ncbi:hypothetical protein [Silicimonas sp. MF1-12-2]|uniref:hypothetical protein n=1 Tax=Silicimonas sp. MF1-12-2 TaxID=3384793 RepID=UPI0039B5FA75